MIIRTKRKASVFEHFEKISQNFAICFNSNFFSALVNDRARAFHSGEHFRIVTHITMASRRCVAFSLNV